MPSLLRQPPSLPLFALGLALLAGAAALSFDGATPLEAQSLGSPAATAGGWSAAPVLALLILATSSGLVLAVTLRNARR